MRNRKPESQWKVDAIGLLFEGDISLMVKDLYLHKDQSQLSDSRNLKQEEIYHMAAVVSLVLR